MRTLLAGMFALLAAQLGRTSVVQASCAPAGLQLLWSYPETGAEQVPTNITFWAVTSAWGARPEATLDGRAVEMQAAPSLGGVYLQPQDLTPNSDHTLVLDYSQSPNVAKPSKSLRFEIKFKTGAGPAEETVARPIIAGSTRLLTDFSTHDCADVISAQDCFDTGQDTLLSLKLEERDVDDTIGWLVKARSQVSNVIWPARCGAPSVYLHRQVSVCFEVQRIGAGGRLSETAEHCSEPTMDMPADGGAGHDGAPTGGTRAASDAGRADAGLDAGAADASRPGAAEAGPAPADAPSSSAGCSTVSGARTAARAFWAIVVIALLLAHSQRHRRRRPRGVSPSRRFRV